MTPPVTRIVERRSSRPCVQFDIEINVLTFRFSAYRVATKPVSNTMKEVEQ